MAGTDPIYSICIIHRNNLETVKQSLESILDQIDSSYEVIVVDARSSDGSLPILESFAKWGKIKLLVTDCSRGKGRQIAFENSVGKYILSNLDMDDVFLPNIKSLLKLYHDVTEGEVVHVLNATPIGFNDKNCAITIASRDVINSIGGWRDLQWAEDWDLWRRASYLGVYRWFEFDILKSSSMHPERRGFPGYWIYKFKRYREEAKAGRTRKNLQGSLAHLWRLARISSRSPSSYEFEPLSPHFRVDWQTTRVGGMGE